MAALKTRSSTWEKFEPLVQSYMRYKTVNDELLECALSFRIDDAADDFDFDAFAQSASDDTYAIESRMRWALGQIGAAKRLERAQREEAEEVERARRVMEGHGYDVLPPEE